MANSSITLTELDFDSYKDSLKSFLRSQEEFKDYDWDGSNMSVLLDLLSYNTYQLGFYLNMIGAESHLDSAQLRDSVVSHAKDLNYSPRSFSSAFAIVDINIKSSDSNKSSIFIPRGTKFSAKLGDNNFIFTTDENITVQGVNDFIAENVTIYEGSIVSESYVTGNRYLINNARADTSSLVVTVLEDNGATVLEYKKAESLFDVDETSLVYFLQGAESGKYEIIFGDGVIGRKPKENSIIQIEYRISSGELPNGAKIFKPLSNIDGETDISITTITAASSGSVNESIDEIKFNAPRYFSTQERGVIAEDYENLLKINFPEINSVVAFGGEELSPPKYGKVYIAIDLKELDFLPDSKISQFQEFIRRRSPVTIEPVFIEADYLYISVNSLVKYDINKSSLSISDMKTIVLEAIQEYSRTCLDDFNKALRYSKFVEAIDSADTSIISNETSLSCYKKISTKDIISDNSIIDFGFSLSEVYSSSFAYKGKQCYLQNDGDILSIYFSSNKLLDIGTVNLETGLINISRFVPDDLVTEIKVYAKTTSLDIISGKNTIINILPVDVTLNVVRGTE